MSAMDDSLRGTGRTTGLMLIAVGTALQKPGEWIEFHDHSPASPLVAKSHQAAAVSMCGALGLNLKVERTGNRVSFLSGVLGHVPLLH